MAVIAEHPLRSGIYLCYRPEDSYGHVQAMLPSLRQRFGSRLTIDPDDLAPNQSPGADIGSLLESCGVVLAVIGRDWLAIRNTAPSTRFLDDASDRLRRLLAAALTNEQILVIPILVAGASLPRSEDLPPELEPLALRHAAQLMGRRWDVDVERLVRMTESAVAGVPIDWQLGPDTDGGAFDLDVVEAKRTDRIADCLRSALLAFEAREYESVLGACDEVVTLNPYHAEALDLASRARLARDQRAAAESEPQGAEAEFGTTHRNTADTAEHQRPRVTVRVDENVQFTVYRRSVVQPARWYPLLAFAHLAERRSDATDEPDPVREVQAQARQVLGESADAFQALTSDSRSGVMRDGELRFVPQVEGVEFNPLERRFIWSESVHREEFRMRASPTMDGRIARGVLTVYAGNLLLADVLLAIKVDKDSRDAREEHSEARPYRRIFASYSHRDRSIVEEFEAHATATGDRYLRDVVSLRAGEQWSDRLREMIGNADVFQLFWSWNAMASPMVHKEWRYALELGRTHFVRPVYWEEPLPEQPGLPPEALRSLHFQRVYPRTESGAIQNPSIPPASPTAVTHAPATAAPRRSTGHSRLRSRRAPMMTRVLGLAALAAPVLAVSVYLVTLNRGAAPPLQPPLEAPTGVRPLDPGPAVPAPALPPPLPAPPTPPTAGQVPPPAPPNAGEAARIAGLAGLSIDEIAVRRILQRPGEFIAMVQGQDGKIHTVRQGDKLADGTVRTINADGLVIIQEVSDPLAPVKQREVVKRLQSP